MEFTNINMFSLSKSFFVISKMTDKENSKSERSTQ